MKPRSVTATRLVPIVAALVLSAVGLTSSAPALGHRRADAIRVTVPTTVKRKVVYDVTIAGYARRHAKAYLFIDYQLCARSFASERARAANESQVYRVNGGFARTSGWKSSDRGFDHACAYLVSATGAVLAEAIRSYWVN